MRVISNIFCLCNCLCNFECEKSINILQRLLNHVAKFIIYLQKLDDQLILFIIHKKCYSIRSMWISMTCSIREIDSNQHYN